MKLQIRHPFLVSFFLLTALFFDGSGVVHGCVVAVLLHEAGHALAYCALLRKRPVFHVGLGGIALYWPVAGIDRTVQTAILLAGPLTNFLCAGICLFGAAQEVRLARLLFGGVNLLLGGFNLLPMGFLDGGRLLMLLLERMFPIPKAVRIGWWMQMFCLLGLSAFLLCHTDWRTRAALLLFLGYYCWRSFCSV